MATKNTLFFIVFFMSKPYGCGSKPLTPWLTAGQMNRFRDGPPASAPKGSKQDDLWNLILGPLPRLKHVETQKKHSRSNWPNWVPKIFRGSQVARFFGLTGLTGFQTWPASAAIYIYISYKYKTQRNFIQGETPHMQSVTL